MKLFENLQVLENIIEHKKIDKTLKTTPIEKC